MIRIASVVEGHGEVEAVPLLLRRFAADWDPTVAFQTAPGIRVTRGTLLRAGELERAVELAVARAQGGGVLVIVDADNDCPADLGPALLARALSRAPRSRVVVAKTEFENWFIAAAESVAGRRGLRADLTTPPDVETIHDAKGWLRRNMADPARSYSETLDQPALASIFDYRAARNVSGSCDKLCREIEAMLNELREADTPIA